MDLEGDDEVKKPFDSEAGHDDDNQPDPDEQLMLDQGTGRVWLVKIPKNLMERWAKLDTDGVHLASVRVYQSTPTSKTRIVLFLPPADTSNRDPSLPQFTLGGPVKSIATIPADEPDTYELDLVHEVVENQVVVAERPKDPSQPNNRARTTILTGRIKHDCNLRPLFTKSYRRQMKERSRKYNTPLRQIQRIEDAGISGGRGGINRLSSGVGVGAGNAFANLIKTKPKGKGTHEKMTRMPRNELLDRLFTLFRDQPRWSVKVLRERTEQPEAYLKEVLSEIAWQHRSGEFNTLWELKEAFKDNQVKPEDVPMSQGGDVDMDDDDDDDDEEEDDDDDGMEEVSVP